MTCDTCKQREGWPCTAGVRLCVSCFDEQRPDISAIESLPHVTLERFAKYWRAIATLVPEAPADPDVETLKARIAELETESRVLQEANKQLAARLHR